MGPLSHSAKNSTKLTPEFRCLEVVYQWASSRSMVDETAARRLSCLSSGINVGDQVGQPKSRRILMDSLGTYFDYFLD
ncbi:hypothetical protein COP2_023678 [Malus domestica]